MAKEMAVAETNITQNITRDGRPMDPRNAPDEAPPSTRQNHPGQPQQRVETMGIEPTTPCLQSRCSAN